MSVFRYTDEPSRSVAMNEARSLTEQLRLKGQRAVYHHGEDHRGCFYKVVEFTQ